MVTISLSHLQGRGVRLETHEAVALARELMAHPCGLPTLDNIRLGSDGSASCMSTDAVPSVASYAELLLRLLPAGIPDVPAPLRYAIARGLEAVEAPPFGSLSEFSATLARFEKGPRADILRAILQRGARPSRPNGPSIIALPTRMAPSAVLPRSPMAAPRPTLVVRNSKPSGPTPNSIVAAPTVTTGVDRETRAVRTWPRWAVGIAAALVVSVTLGFGVMHRVLDRRVATAPARSARVSPEVLGTAPAANLATVQRTDETVRASQATRVAREIPPPLGAGPDTAPDTRSRPVEHTPERVGAVHAVRTTGGDAVSPAVASDGTAVFVPTGSESETRRAVDRNAGDLGIMTVLDGASHNDHAQPSPDNRFVAFDSDRDGQRGIYVANRDGSHVRRVSGAGYAAVPTWSPNTEWLAYIRPETDNASVWNLWVQNAAGGQARRLTNYRDGQTSAASWFPGNRRIAYSHDDTLTVIDVQTGETMRYRTPVKGRLVRTPAVSPDGTKIIFQVVHDGAWLLDLANGSMERVLTDPTADEFAWAADGWQVAFHSRRDGHWGIYVL